MTFLPIARPDGALASVALLVWGAIGGLSRWRVGLIADRVGLTRLLPASSALNIIGIVTVAAGLLLQGASSWIVIVIGSAMLGAGYGAVQNLTLVAAFQRARHRQLVTVSSVWNIGFDTGLALGSGVVGMMTAAMPIAGALALTGLLILASMPLAVRVSRPTADAPPREAAR